MAFRTVFEMNRDYMHYQYRPAWDLFFIGVVAYGIALMVRLEHYYERIAILENRLDDFHSRKCVDEGGNNSFRREKLWELISRKYLKFEDDQLTTIGNDVRTRLITSYAITAVFILWLVVLVEKICI